MWELSKRENEGEWQAVGMGHQLTDAPTDTRSVVWHQVLCQRLSVPSERPIPCPETGDCGARRSVSRIIAESRGYG